MDRQPARKRQACGPGTPTAGAPDSVSWSVRPEPFVAGSGGTEGESGIGRSTGRDENTDFARTADELGRVPDVVAPVSTGPA